MKKITEYLKSGNNTYDKYFKTDSSYKVFSKKGKGLELGKICPSTDNDKNVCNYNNKLLPAFWESYGLATGMCGRIPGSTILASWVEYSIDKKIYDHKGEFFKPPKLVYSTSDMSETFYQPIKNVSINQTFIAKDSNTFLVNLNIKTKIDITLSIYFSKLNQPIHKNNFNLDLTPQMPVKIINNKDIISFNIINKYSFDTANVSVD